MPKKTASAAAPKSDSGLVKKPVSVVAKRGGTGKSKVNGVDGGGRKGKGGEVSSKSLNKEAAERPLYDSSDLEEGAASRAQQSGAQISGGKRKQRDDPLASCEGAPLFCKSDSDGDGDGGTGGDGSTDSCIAALRRTWEVASLGLLLRSVAALPLPATLGDARTLERTLLDSRATSALLERFCAWGELCARARAGALPPPFDRPGALHPLL
eukprot:6213554-Pleurochrysis_carterae.AAC.1